MIDKTKRIIIGLGNPGSQYAQTRHNVGQQFLDFAWPNLAWKFEKLGQYVCALSPAPHQAILVKPQTYMNRSGDALRFLQKKYEGMRAEQLVVVHDDLDLTLGSWKVQLGTGPHGHNGLESLYAAWGSTNFWHVRIGIDGRAGDRSIPSTAYVLQPFTPVEREKLQAVFAQIMLHPLVNSQLDQ